MPLRQPHAHGATGCTGTFPTENAPLRSKMGTFAEMLAANGTITRLQNGLGYPVHLHEINPVTAFNMFYSILHPLVLRNHRFLGVQTPSDGNDLIELIHINQSVSYDALLSMFAVLYYKNLRFEDSSIGFLGSAPPVAAKKFPVFVTALINSIGPVKFDGIPARGTHIPWMSETSVDNVRPNQYQSHYIGMFNNAIVRSAQVALSSVDLMSSASSPWWTFHSYAERERDAIQSISLWSPVLFDACDNALKLGVLYAKTHLTVDVGVINFSATPFYDLNDPPREDLIPEEAFDYPYYATSQPAYFQDVRT